MFCNKNNYPKKLVEAIIKNERHSQQTKNREENYEEDQDEKEQDEKPTTKIKRECQ